MKSQISRHSFRRDKRYSGVYQQQGRMITDADWNELNDIVKLRLQEALKDVVASGATSKHGIVDVSSTLPKLKWGHVYVDGLRAVVQPDMSKYDDASPPTALLDYSKQHDFPAAPAFSTNDYVLYADVWERTVLSLEDDQLRDPGLNGADTCSRTQVMAQVKWCADSIDPISDKDRNPSRGNALLELQERSVDEVESDPCDPCAREVALDHGSGNYLFRVEIHEVVGHADNPEKITFKWSIENGAEAHPCSAVPADFKTGSWIYEFYSDTSEKHLGVHLFDDLTFVARGRFEENGYPTSMPSEPLVRRWDGYCTIDITGGDAVTGKERNKSLSLTTEDDANAELGDYRITGDKIKLFLSTLELELEFKGSGKKFVAGDYWLAQVRKNSPAEKRVQLVSNKPLGIKHHYVKLLAIKGGVVQPLTDAERRQFSFPSLSNLDAHHVAYNANKKLSRWQDIHDDAGLPMPLTVQEAIDDLLVNLESSDINFTFPTCPSEGITINSLIRNSPGWLDFDSDGKSNSIKDVLYGLLCYLDSSRLPYDVDDDKTVKDFVDALKIELGHKVDKRGDSMSGGLAIHDKLIVDQRIGIGTSTTPAAKLAINGGVHVGGESDPGNDNLLVDGTCNIGGACTIGGSSTVAGACTVGGNCTIEGDLIVNGTHTTVNTAEMVIEDPVITLNRFAGNGANPSVNSGMEVKRGSSGNNAQLLWNETNDQWEYGIVGNMTPIAGGQQATVTGLVRFNNVPVNVEVVSDWIDPGLGSGKVCVQLGHYVNANIHYISDENTTYRSYI